MKIPVPEVEEDKDEEDDEDKDIDIPGECLVQLLLTTCASTHAGLLPTTHHLI